MDSETGVYDGSPEWQNVQGPVRQALRHIEQTLSTHALALRTLEKSIIDLMHQQTERINSVSANVKHVKSATAEALESHFGTSDGKFQEFAKLIDKALAEKERAIRADTRDKLAVIGEKLSEYDVSFKTLETKANTETFAASLKQQQMEQGSLWSTTGELSKRLEAQAFQITDRLESLERFQTIQNQKNASDDKQLLNIETYLEKQHADLMGVIQNQLGLYEMDFSAKCKQIEEGMLKDKELAQERLNVAEDRMATLVVESEARLTKRLVPCLDAHKAETLEQLAKLQQAAQEHEARTSAEDKCLHDRLGSLEQNFRLKVSAPSPSCFRGTYA
ncbi:hypothetical protein CYMTET_10130 [Cymbomonas tetramitiformis]|uniref:Uncharacterized protein n=1 Tax=Cymbomonas tetramitiformis TaxID=36881 RepID=A0AAE0GPR5_9CHLO|nr:hypothetical protein CYMTET_10130 [Cymbomonas tetramitiformis]